MPETQIVVDCETGEQTETEMSEREQANVDTIRAYAVASEQARLGLVAVASNLDEIELDEVLLARPDAIKLARISAARRLLARGELPSNELLGLLGISL